MNLFGVRQDNNSTSDVIALSLDNDWRLDPRLRIEHRRFSVDDSQQWTLGPALRPT
jgi:hypothetical protein